MRIDMHMHSTASDGQYTPTELVRKVKDAGIAIMALTDHDSIGGVEEAVGTAKECGIICIPGIELSIEHENELHMLGYGIDIHDRELKAFCEEMVQERSTRNEKIITFLADQGVDVTMEEVAEKAGSDVIGRPHFARVMVEKGYVSSVKEAFDKYLATEEGQEMWCEGTGQVPVSQTVQQEDYFQNDKFMKVSMEGVDIAGTVPVKDTTTEWISNWPATISQALTGEITAKECMDKLDKALNE